MVGQITGKNELKKNGSGYSDPTAYKAIMNVGGATVMNTYHGDIFYIANDGRVGETPAIIVSPDTWLEQDPEFVQAVLMTTKENEQLPTHVEVMCRVQSIALCERIFKVDTDRIGEYIRSCTAEEIKKVDEAIALTLGIAENNNAADLERIKQLEEQLEKEKETSDRILKKFREETERYNELEREKGYGNDKEYIRAVAERDVYKNMYMDLLERKMNG